MPTFAERMKELRVSRGLSQRDLANKLELSNSTVAMYESGKRMPSIDALENVSDFFNVDIDYLLGNTDIRSRISFRGTATNRSVEVPIEPKFEAVLDLTDFNNSELSVMIAISKFIKTLSDKELNKLVAVINASFDIDLNKLD